MAPEITAMALSNPSNNLPDLFFNVVMIALPPSTFTAFSGFLRKGVRIPNVEVV
jgi:hypothetical protein